MVMTKNARQMLMGDKEMTPDIFLESKDMRDKCINKIELLDKVKQIFLLPELECLTTKQMADYFEVGYEAIKSQYKNNQKEFDEDGVTLKKPSDFKVLNGLDKTVQKWESKRGYTVITLDTNTILEISNRGIKCFPKRAILRMGMLLQGSRVSQEVRTQLLNTFEHTTEEQRTTEINEEMELRQNIALAYGKDNPMEILQACSMLDAYRMRHIAKIEQHNAELAQENAKISEEKEKVEEINKGLTTTNAALVKEQNTWEPRPIINALVKTYARSRYPWQQNKYAKAWDDFYYNLKYKYHIDIVSRHIRNNKIGGKIAYIRHNEFDRAIKVAVAMCEQRGIDTGKIINEVNSEAAKSTDKAGAC